MSADRRAPAASTSNTLPLDDRNPIVTKTTAPMYAPPNTAQASECHAAVAHRACETPAYQSSQAFRRPAISLEPTPVTRTSLPGAAVVAVVNRCRPSRVDEARLPHATRSTVGLRVDVHTAGSAKTASSISTG